MNPTPAQAIEMLTRLERNRKREPVVESTDEGDDHESKVRKQITDWCDAQWPKWVYWGARTDKRSTLPKGCHDLTIAGPNNVNIFVDTKSRTGKPSPDQLVWQAQLRHIGREVHFVKTFDQFLEAVELNQKNTNA